MPAPAPIGLITGTGLYELEGLEDRRTEEVTTPHGTATVTLGTLAGRAGRPRARATAPGTPASRTR